MKGLVEFINEAILEEGKSKLVKITLPEEDGVDKKIEDISYAANHAKIYFEKVDGHTFLLKVVPGKDVSKITSILQDIIDEIPEEKKEEKEADINKINSYIEKLNDASAEEEKPEKKEEE